MIRTIAIAAAALALAGAASAQTPPASKDVTVDIQGAAGSGFSDPKIMTPFYEILRDTHLQGPKADLDVMEEKIRAMVPTLTGGQKPSVAMEDHVLGVAHQALAMGVANPKMFASYKDFMTAMLGPS